MREVKLLYLPRDVKQYCYLIDVQAVDWWSVGVLTYELLTGASPFTVEGEKNTQQGWKLMSCSHCQELGHLADMASDWLFTLVQPIRGQPA